MTTDDKLESVLSVVKVRAPGNVSVEFSDFIQHLCLIFRYKAAEQGIAYVTAGDIYRFMVSICEALGTKAVARLQSEVTSSVMFGRRLAMSDANQRKVGCFIQGNGHPRTYILGENAPSTKEYNSTIKVLKTNYEGKS